MAGSRVFSVPKCDIPELIAYAKALKKAQKPAQPIPEAIEQALHPEVARLVRLDIHPKDMPKNLRDDLYEIIELGPYVRYRWREGKHLYTISLGLLDDYPPRPFTPACF